MALSVRTTGSAGVPAGQNEINSMWPRDAGGTQVYIGMIWGWRLLDPNGPFPQNNGHPLSYANQATLAWKKAVILMTDGTEEWLAHFNDPEGRPLGILARVISRPA